MDYDKLLQIKADSKDGKVSVGGTFVELQDKTRGRFRTESPMDFIEYLKNFEDKPPVFFNSKNIIAFRAIDPKQEDGEMASCDIVKTNILKYLISQENEDMGIKEFDNFLRTTREFISGQESLKIVDFLENAQVKKIKTVSRQRDNRGNFSYTVKSESDQNDFAFPKKLTFRVPLIKHIPEEKELDFDFFFEYVERGEGVSFNFRIKSIRLGEIVEETIESIISELLDKADTNYRKGGFEIIKDTDSWKYHDTPLKITR